MAKPTKFATLEEAIVIHERGDEFVYNNPCSKCKKECSTPTLDIWKRRINLFGGVKEMYEGYVCRDCKGAEKGDKPKNAIIPIGKPVNVPLTKLPPKDEIDVLDENVELIEQPPTPTAHAVASNLPTVIIKPYRNDPEPGETVHVPPGKVIVRVWEVGGGEPRRFVGSNAYDL